MDSVAQTNKHSKTFKVRLRNLLWRLISPLPDKPYLYLKYATIYGRFPDFKQPKRFSELQQIRKLKDRTSAYNVVVDKADAKAYIEERVGAKYIIPTYWVGTNLAEIDWATIPLPAVVKPTHASGEGFFLRTSEDVARLMKSRPEADWLALNHFHFNREWAYKDVEPRIVVEHMLGKSGELLTDYRFYCFNGDVVHIEVRMPIDGQMHEAVFTPEWKLTPVHMDYYPTFTDGLDRPENLDEMLDVAKKIGSGIPFARVDLYNLDEGLFVGEITLYPSGGFETFVPDSYDLELAEHWNNKSSAVAAQ